VEAEWERVRRSRLRDVLLGLLGMLDDGATLVGSMIQDCENQQSKQLQMVLRMHSFAHNLEVSLFVAFTCLLLNAVKNMCVRACMHTRTKVLGCGTHVVMHVHCRSVFVSARYITHVTTLWGSGLDYGVQG
jgi:N12 class adenine-specific DNA methylase